MHTTPPTNNETISSIFLIKQGKHAETEGFMWLYTNAFKLESTVEPTPVNYMKFEVFMTEQNLDCGLLGYDSIYSHCF
jgi:hypothetical protein